jgi:Xaa-Pro aminopeptidase
MKRRLKDGFKPKRTSLRWALMAAALFSVGTTAACSRSAPAQGAAAPDLVAPRNADWGIPDAKERFEIHKAIVLEKLDTALLPAMRAHAIDMWMVLDRENNDDPVHDELGGGYSGVRAAFIFFDNGGDKVEKIYYGSHEQPATSVIAQIYDEKQYYGYSEAGLTPLLRSAVQKRNPKKIAVETSYTVPDLDGLTVGMRDFLVKAIGPAFASRIVSGESVARDFRTTRTPLEQKLYKTLLEWSSRWQSDALSDAHVTPGTTTAADIAWYLEDSARRLGLAGSGTPRVVRAGDLLPLNAENLAIQPGDIISIDGGLKYLGYATDIKRTAYVLRPGESAPPAHLQSAWRDTLKVADLYAKALVPGRVGHEVWDGLMAQTQKMGYAVAYPDSGGRAASTTKPEVGVYGHSVGNVEHDVGARIAQDWPFAFGDRVDCALRQNEWESIEFHVSTPVSEWGGKTWYARFEENVRVGPDGAEWIIPRQEQLLLIHQHGSTTGE